MILDNYHRIKLPYNKKFSSQQNYTVEHQNLNTQNLGCKNIKYVGPIAKCKPKGMHAELWLESVIKCIDIGNVLAEAKHDNYDTLKVTLNHLDWIAKVVKIVNYLFK